MKLHWSPRSPFVRKVMIVLHETGQLDDVELVRSMVAMPLPPNPSVLRDNPLGKIPTLVTDDGIALFDSRVICEYLNLRANAELFPSEPVARMRALRWQALGDGLTDVLLLWRTELTRPNGAWPAVTDGWLSKVRACMELLESEADSLRDAPFGIGHIALVCALGQMDFRWSSSNWREHFPALAARASEWTERNPVRQTVVANDQTDDNGVTQGHLTFVDS
jgi:glutathione S-transferase